MLHAKVRRIEDALAGDAGVSDHPRLDLAVEQARLAREAGKPPVRRGAGRRRRHGGAERPEHRGHRLRRHRSRGVQPGAAGQPDPRPRPARVRPLHQHRAVRDVCRGDLLGRDHQGGLRSGRVRARRDDGRRPGEPDAGAAVPPGVRGRPAPDRGARARSSCPRPARCTRASGAPEPFGSSGASGLGALRLLRHPQEQGAVQGRALPPDRRRGRAGGSGPGGPRSVAPGCPTAPSRCPSRSVPGAPRPRRPGRGPCW